MIEELKVGDRVRSKAIGKIPEFDGVVTEIMVNGKNETLYHVRDKAGKYWLRDRDDLLKQRSRIHEA